MWEPSPIYPDPSIEILDPRFLKYRLFNAAVERLATGLRWGEGPVWLGDQRCLLVSDIPNDRILRWDEETGAITHFRSPSQKANGNTRDRQGRLVTCEHGGRRVIRTEYDGSITVLASHYEGRRLNSPNDVVVKSDGSIWFTDPHFGLLSHYEGEPAPQELPQNVYRIDPDGLGITAVAENVAGPTACASRPTSAPSTWWSRAPRPIASSRPMTSPPTAAPSPTAASSSMPGRAARRTASAATSTAISGAAGGWGRRSSTASWSSRPTAPPSAASACPSAAPMSVSAAATATACSWRPAAASMRSM